MEGPDGAGKTTQLKLLGRYLQEAGCEVVLTREPGGTPLAETIRKILLDPQSQDIDPMTEALLYAAARAQHVAEVIRPALTAGKIVLCDRFIDSSIVYQGGGRGLAQEDIMKINEIATGGLKPHLTILLDLEPEEAFKRLAQRTSKDSQELDRMEQESKVFYQKVREAYLALAQREERIKVVPAWGTIEEIQQRIIDLVSNYLR